MGDDLSVVNAARVSFGKMKYEVDESDERLIKYLAKHQHFTPFTHATVKIHSKVPLFVARQLHKHQVGFSVNEISGRYVEFKNSFYDPSVWRKSAPNVKQGSSDEPIDNPEMADSIYESTLNKCMMAYDYLLKLGVCKEQARAVLPLATNTEFITTASLFAWARLYNLRSGKHAQAETREYAEKVGEIMLDLFPISWQALTGLEQKG